MADPFRNPDRGAFLSFLDWIDRPGQVVRNTIKGQGGGALRQAGQFGLDTLDALLPGDWLPNDLAREEDYVSGGDLVGIDHEKNPILGTVADIGVGLLTDPISYIPGAAVAKGLGAAGKAATKAVSAVDKVLPGTEQAISKAGQGIRSVFAEPRMSGANKETLNRAHAARSNVSRAGLDETRRIMGGLSDQEAEIVGDIIDNYKWQDGKLIGSLTGKPTLNANALSLPGAKFIEDETTALQRIALHGGVTPENQERITRAIEEIVGKDGKMGFSQRQAQEGIERGIFKEARNVTDAIPGVTEDVATEIPMRGTMHTDEIQPVSKGIDRFRKDYLQRIFSGQTADEVTDAALGNPSAVKGLKLETVEETADFLAKNPNVKFERNAAKRLAQRAEQQGTLAQRAEIGRAFQKHFAYADPDMRNAVLKQIEALPAEEANVLMNAFKGMPARSTPMDWLASANRFFKPFAVYGAAIPKMGSIVRNRMSGVWQALSNPEARGTVLESVKRLPSDLADAVTQSLGLKKLAVGELSSKINAIDAAFAQSGGVAENAMRALEQAGLGDVAQLMRSGALDGFVTSEELLKEMGRTGWKKQFSNIMDWPGKVFRATEDRMRLGMGLDLLKQGKSADEAAKIVRESLYDYNVNTVGNRRARDFIPFFQFAAKAIPQQAKLMAEKPFVAVGLSQALQQRPDEPIYPWQEGRLNIPFGETENGNALYASGLGLPFEALNQIPGSVRDFKKNVVGSSQPLLKSAFSAISGDDVYFETPYGSYDKIPAIGEAGDAGRLYNQIAGTGMIQPLDSLLRTIGTVTNPDRSAGIKALDFLTGINFREVDPDLALQQQLQEALSGNPDVRKYSGMYSTTNDPETMELLEQLKDAKARVKAKRSAKN